MAVRQQQRRGTASQWTSANPILSAAEIGYETDTNKFKIGDGTNRWATLSYFVDLDTMIAGAPGLLNSLDEIAAAINDDPAFFTTIASSLSSKAPIASPTFTGTVSGITKTMVGLGSVDNTADTAKPISSATQTALDLKANSADITELSQDAVNAALTAGTGITKTYNDAANTITVAVDTAVMQYRVDGVSDTEISYLDGVTSAIQSQINAKLASSTASSTYAPIISPQLSGTPISTHATLGDSSAQIATTKFVQDSINNLNSYTLTLDGGGV